ncbi:type II toxin-antitoxin system PemK/MazF family toxin [Actinomyces sp.]
MNSFVTGVVRALAEFISTLSSSSSDPSATDATATRQENTPRPRSTTSTPTHTPKPSDRSRPHGSSQHQDPATSKRPRTSIREASIADALAHASYQPIMDGDADPGEVVWTWVPYQEDASVGKDRPAVVIGAQGEGVYLLQLTSKDHSRDAAEEAAAGRYWFDIGSGAWDPKGRPSEVRLDRALWVKATDVRREGSILPEVTWRRIIDALEEHHRTHGD